MRWGPMTQQPGASSCAGLLGSTRTAYKPGSVGRRIALTVIPLGVRSPAPSSSLPAASWSRRTASRRLFGLAPTGVCRAVIVAADAVGSYPTFSPLPARMQAVCFLWHFPSRLRRRRARAQALPGSLSKEPGLSSVMPASAGTTATVQPLVYDTQI
jgi:hypothetical protein